MSVAGTNRSNQDEEEKKAPDLKQEESIIGNFSNLWKDFWKPRPEFKLPIKQPKNDSFQITLLPVSQENLAKRYCKCLKDPNFPMFCTQARGWY